MRSKKENECDLKIGRYHFGYVCEILPTRNEDGSVKEFMPQGRYENIKGLPLNKYGAGPYCEFNIPTNYNYSGVYALLVDGEVKYIGECQNLSSRYNMGYCNISPRNCFIGGQETNCRINNLILGAARKGRAISLWFMPTEKYKKVEQELRELLGPEWNRV